MSKFLSRYVGLGFLAALAFVVAGCGKVDSKGAKAGKQDTHHHGDGKHDHSHDHDQAKADKKVDDHSGWWCDNHGIPEEECSMCSPKAEKEAKEKGDWCKEHERALSQCFHCKPERREFYAAKHRAKLGKEPPPIPEFDDKKPKEAEKEKKEGDK